MNPILLKPESHSEKWLFGQQKTSTVSAGFVFSGFSLCELNERRFLNFAEPAAE